MNIYLISQDKCTGYDTYDSAVVVARDTEDARGLHPSGIEPGRFSFGDEWPKPEFVRVQLIGAALGEDTARVVCASFNAG